MTEIYSGAMFHALQLLARHKHRDYGVDYVIGITVINEPLLPLSWMSDIPNPIVNTATLLFKNKLYIDEHWEWVFVGVQ